MERCWRPEPQKKIGPACDRNHLAVSDEVRDRAGFAGTITFFEWKVLQFAAQLEPNRYIVSISRSIASRLNSNSSTQSRGPVLFSSASFTVCDLVASDSFP